MLFLASSFILHASEIKEFDTSKISTVEVKNTSGEIRVLAASEKVSSVVATKRQFGENCQLIVDQRGAALVVEVKKARSAPECEVDLEVKAPRVAGLSLESGSGRIRVEGLSGDLNFRSGSGRVDVDSEIHHLNGQTGSGDISLRGLKGGGNLLVGSGRVSLVYRTAPSSGTLIVRAGSGSTDIAFPKSAKVSTSYSAGSGRLINELGDAPDAKFKILVQSGSGDLHIRSQ